jgi:hypothetical protein
MEEKQRKWEEIVHSKLYDFEADVRDDDWNRISSKLSPKGKVVVFSHYRRYISLAAAVFAGLILLSGVYYFVLYQPSNDQIANVNQPASELTVQQPEMDKQQPKTETQQPEAEAQQPKAETQQTETADQQQGKAVRPSKPAVDKPVEKPVENNNATVDKPGSPVDKPVDKPVENNYATVDKPVNPVDKQVERLTGEQQDISSEKQQSTFKVIPLADLQPQESDPTQSKGNTELIASSEPVYADASPQAKPRRWGFGMGGSSYSMNSSSNTVVPVSLLSDKILDENILDRNDMPLRGDATDLMGTEPDIRKNTAGNTPSANIKHLTPLSAGFGVSYYLNDRWALQSGLVYTLLRSKWSIENFDGYEVKNKQNLHFLGIPLSASYKIAEWRRFQFYAAAGGMFEYNVRGKLKKTTYSDNLKTNEDANIRMKKPFWSVNTRAGINYSLWKFINLYGEVGASYFFDNESDVETIRSKRPLDVSLQAGIRLSI